MGAGVYNRKIVPQRKTIAYDAYNQQIDTWVDGTGIWSQVITSGGKEFYAAQKLFAETSAVFKIPYTEKIHKTMRIKWGTRIFEILCEPSDPDGMRKEILITAKEVT